MKQLWLNIAHTSGAKVYSLLVGVLTLSLTARLLGPEGRGQVAVITTWVSMFSTFCRGQKVGKIGFGVELGGPPKLDS